MAKRMPQLDGKREFMVRAVGLAGKRWFQAERPKLKGWLSILSACLY